MKTVINKIAQAKKIVKELEIKKEGRNTYSNYDYYTPSQIEGIVQHVCDKVGIMTKFDLKRNDLGEFGLLTIYDLDNADSIIYEMSTAIPEIKATNIAQQIGGCATYTERYLKTFAFGITDNNLDFDTSDKKSGDKLKEQIIEKINNCSTHGDLTKLYSSLDKSLSKSLQYYFTQRKEEISNA